MVKKDNSGKGLDIETVYNLIFRYIDVLKKIKLIP